MVRGSPAGGLGSGPEREDHAGMVANLLCRLRWHKWKRMENDEGGGHYLQCQRCGKDRNVSGGPGDWVAPVGY